MSVSNALCELVINHKSAPEKVTEAHVRITRDLIGRLGKIWGLLTIPVLDSKHSDEQLVSVAPPSAASYEPIDSSSSTMAGRRWSKPTA
jgi:hypothetical protein